MTFYSGSVIGFFLGFAFGVGCALTVMYAIYLGGYRAAIRDASLTPQPERYRVATAKQALKKDTSI